MLMITWTMTIPFISQIDTCYNSHFSTTGRENNSQMLILYIAFYGIFLVTSVSIQFAFTIIDRSILENIFYFRFIDMPAIHSASCMFGIMKMRLISIQPINLLTRSIAVYKICISFL